LACFLAQQCTEKYLKARLFEAGIPFAKTHDLTVLLSDVAPVEPAWTLFAADLRLLSDYAVRFRYPGKPANRSVARDAVGRCKDFRAAARLALGLK
jgi:HEPN domain-containing protein